MCWSSLHGFHFYFVPCNSFHWERPSGHRQPRVCGGTLCWAWQRPDKVKHAQRHSQGGHQSPHHMDHTESCSQYPHSTVSSTVFSLPWLAVTELQVCKMVKAGLAGCLTCWVGGGGSCICQRADPKSYFLVKYAEVKIPLWGVLSLYTHLPASHRWQTLESQRGEAPFLLPQKTCPFICQFCPQKMICYPVITSRCLLQRFDQYPPCGQQS